MNLINQLIDYLQYPKSLERLGSCSLCDQFNKETMVCNQCGCMMKAKVLIPLASCPLKKW